MPPTSLSVTACETERELAGLVLTRSKLLLTMMGELLATASYVGGRGRGSCNAFEGVDAGGFERELAWLRVAR